MLQINLDALYGTRLLVFVEDAPQSNQYRQVLLTPEQFKKVSDAICTVISTDGKTEQTEVLMSTDIYKLPDLFEMLTE